MKSKVFLFMLLCAFGLFIQAAGPAKKSDLIGIWKLVRAETNGQPNPASQMNRSFQYAKDGLFEGKLFSDGQVSTFPRGRYFIADDSTMVCINLSPDNKVVGHPNTYRFKIKNDTLNIYGVWYGGVAGQPNLLRMNFINEYWVRMK